ncbi:MAG: 2-hydroxyacid dehydrogenase [Paracoccaceae bacterium]|uniref:2-hydroxyacid dehydrogenase n=1 Tax=Candidatus Salinivivens marinus TaxID=3381703 RepID=UPI000B71BEB0|nr:glyoxylate/hydroxypyruvate reductase A [Marinovum sp.]MAJ22095.1 glyoxylate/hydroxypyruvate reductase A [Marinovum sp.]OUU07161.1 MAG: glyoxylate/hydroxypyruvate reductase A [Rhodobacteraceae bacterium TMED38]OUU13786.1 MAG: glyoxylate/hydroxypyruvate reductase A [Rhodobacteraceae bacterium TMED38]PDH59756.1 MAG: glyoxylate/hydroxypyruvate reductase A [Rhodobacteraceae bacterium MED-G08]|tara:strand:+ start:5026 stop:5958 length:933 start_codon:yes stop_codon:yes gene_type:complete
MTIKILFSANEENWKRYKAPLQDALDDKSLDYELGTNITPSEVDYIIYAPSSSLQDFSPYTKLKAVLNLWAGVEGVTNNKTLKVPLARMVDSGLTDGMVEWVTGHTLRHHLGIDKHIHGQDGIWRSYVPPLAKDRVITILGLGTLGTACGIALKRLGFNVRGWSRREKRVDGILCFYGDEQIDSSLMDADIVVLLLPDTPLTQNILNQHTLNLLKRGAFVLNPGRGPLIDDDALLAALDSGQIEHATLDVFRIEPLPQNHQYWSNNKVTVIPHKASETRPKTASQVISMNIEKAENGEELLYLVDRENGY